MVFSLRKRRAPSPSAFASLGWNALAVMAARTARGLTGRLSAAEARRMVAEKQAAAVKASFAFVKHAARGDLKRGAAASFDVYDRAVGANRKRMKRKS